MTVDTARSAQVFAKHPRSEAKGADRTAPARFKFAMYAIVLIAFGLLTFQLDAKSLSGDEFGNVQIESGTFADVFTHVASTWSQHPPGSHLIIHAWIGLTGAGDFAVRYPAVCWAMLSVALLYQLGKRWLGKSIGVTAAVLFAVAPNLILYGRMEKYYSLAVMLVLVSMLVFDRAVRRPTRALLLLQGLIGLIILYTDYFAALFVVGTQNVIALLIWRRDQQRLIGWLLPQIAALLLFLPFANTVLAQVQSVANSPEADLATGWLAVIAKLAYFPYAYSVGETIFPWMPTAIIGTVSYALLALRGVRACLKNAKPNVFTSPGIWIIVLFAAAILGGTGLTSTVLTTVPLITLPNHVLFALPFYVLLVGIGLHHIKQRRDLVAGFIIVLLIPSHLNYYTHQQFHNPVFVTPSRDVLAHIVERSQPGDLLIQDIASGASYYYAAQRLTQPELIENPDVALERLKSGQFHRVWLASVGRDRTRFAEPDPVTTWLEHNLRLAETTGFAEQDPTYRAIKARLTGRPAYQYRVVVQLFVKP